MRPTPAETIAGIRTILKEVVEPEVRSEHALSRLREVRAVLAQVDWDDAALHLRRRHEETRDQLARVRAWIEADPDRARELTSLSARIDSVPEGDAETFVELNVRQDATAGLLVEAIEALARRSRAHPDDASGRALRLDLLRELAR